MKVGFDGGIKLEFHGAKVTSDGGLLSFRDLDDALGLFNRHSPYQNYEQLKFSTISLITKYYHFQVFLPVFSAC